MYKNLKLAVLVMVSVVSAGTVYADNISPAKVTPISIPQERIDLRVQIITDQGQAETPELRKAVREDLINIELMSQEALKSGLDKQSEVSQKLELSKQTILASAFVQEYMKKHPVSNETLAQEYERLKAVLGSKEYKVRHILVEKESAAISISAKLKKGGWIGNIDRLAKINSKDEETKDHGGDVGWVPVGNIPSAFDKPFGDALMKLSKGEISEPVHTQYGWHVIKLEDVRDLKLPSFEELKPKLIQRVQQDAVKQMVSILRDKAKIE